MIVFILCWNIAGVRSDWMVTRYTAKVDLYLCLCSGI